MESFKTMHENRRIYNGPSMKPRPTLWWWPLETVTTSRRRIFALHQPRRLCRFFANPSYRDVHVLVVSSIGAGESRIIAGYGIGRMIEFHLRHVLKDHDGQEATFLSAMKERTMIVRPTALTEHESTGKTTLFDSHEKCPTLKTDRKDLADWLVNNALYGGATADHFGSKPLNITCV